MRVTKFCSKFNISIDDLYKRKYIVDKSEPVTITNLINKMENLEKLTKEMAMKEVADNQDMKYLILRNCLPEGRSHNEFQWNLEIDGITKAPDWNSVPEMWTRIAWLALG